MGLVCSNENRKCQIIYDTGENPQEFCYNLTIEDEEPLNQIKYIPVEITSEDNPRRLIQKQNELFPLDAIASIKRKPNVKIQLNTDINHLTEFNPSSKGILKSTTSQIQSMKSEKRVTFSKSKIKQEKYFKSDKNRRHKVTLRDLEQMF